jgi:hypothetical protein
MPVLHPKSITTSKAYKVTVVFFVFLFFPQFCDVPEVGIIYMKISPNLAMNQVIEWKNIMNLPVFLPTFRNLP